MLNLSKKHKYQSNNLYTYYYYNDVPFAIIKSNLVTNNTSDNILEVHIKLFRNNISYNQKVGLIFVLEPRPKYILPLRVIRNELYELIKWWKDNKQVTINSIISDDSLYKKKKYIIKLNQ